MSIIPKAQSPTCRTQKSRIRSSDLQNAKRRAGRRCAPARQNHFSYGLQKPEIACLPTAYKGKRRRFRLGNRAFVLSSRYGMTIMEIRGANPRIPTLFCVRRETGSPIARLLQRFPGPTARGATQILFRAQVRPEFALSPRHGRARPGHPRLEETDARASLRSPGHAIEASLRLTSIPPSRQPSRAGP